MLLDCRVERLRPKVITDLSIPDPRVDNVSQLLLGTQGVVERLFYGLREKLHEDVVRCTEKEKSEESDKQRDKIRK
jgi:hypothetical protein